jgi:hypothetical protein
VEDPGIVDLLKAADPRFEMPKADAIRNRAFAMHEEV